MVLEGAPSLRRDPDPGTRPSADKVLDDLYVARVLKGGQMRSQVAVGSAGDSPQRHESQQLAWRQGVQGGHGSEPRGLVDDLIGRVHLSPAHPETAQNERAASQKGDDERELDRRDEKGADDERGQHRAYHKQAEAGP